MIDLDKLKLVWGSDLVELQLTVEPSSPWHLLEINEKGELILFRNLSRELFVVNEHGALEDQHTLEP